MFSTIKRYIGQITVRENEGVISVEGVPAYVMSIDIKSLFETDKINKNMFIHLDNSSFSFNSFYALDVLYAIERLVGSGRNLKVNVMTLNKIAEKLLEFTWLSKTVTENKSKLDYSKLKDLIYTPLPFQQNFFEAYDENTQKYNLNGFLFAAAPGTGKTYSSLALTNCLDLDVIIVLCPKNALHKVWENSIQTLFHKKQSYWISSSGKEPTGKERFYVSHYESLTKVLKFIDLFKGKKVGIILDESHNFNEVTSLRASYFVHLCKQTDSKNVIWLSGTPIKALAIESIPLLRAIDSLFTKEVEMGFRKIFGKSGSKAIEILNNRLGLVTFKVEKKELGLLPPVFSDIKVKIPNWKDYTLPAVKKAMQEFTAQRTLYYKDREKKDTEFYYSCLTEYEKLLKSKQEKIEYEYYRKCLKIVIASGGDFSAKEEIMYCNRYELNKIYPSVPQDKRSTFRDTRSIVKYVRLKIQGECLGRIVSALRIQCHLDMIPFIDFKSICESTIKKTVVFTSFTKVVEDTQKQLEINGMNPLVVYGKTNSNLSAIVTSFEKNELLNPLIATYKSLSTAVPLVMADTMILIDSPYRDYILQQAVSRIHRLGSDTQVYVFVCSLDTGEEVNISTRSFDILAWSQKQCEEIIGIKSPFDLTDNPESLEFSLEGFSESIKSSVEQKPKNLSW